LRTVNKVANAYFSQMVESRTLRSFGMNYYNSNLGDEQFAPQTFQPIPWGWFGIPVPEGSKLGDVFTHVDLPDLTESYKDIEFLLQIAEKASAATTFQQGEKPQQQITLGEVQLLLKNATERVKSMAVFYTQSWKDFGIKYTKMLEASPHLLDAVRIHKKGRLTNKMYTKEISPKDYLAREGYAVQVEMMSDKEANDQDDLQWLNAAKTVMPNNKTVDTAYKTKLLERAHLSAEQMSEALKEDKQQAETMAKLAQQQAQQPNTVPGQVVPGQQPTPGTGLPAGAMGGGQMPAMAAA
ncbi:MAG: hypothetical protein KGI08_05230, partial [Thaumarchaeota archaeon]|nr:hypothetical protein [Nitrososphaerota archaeon]